MENQQDNLTPKESLQSSEFCPKCDGLGYIKGDNNGYFECGCLKLNRARMAIESSEITEFFSKKNFDNFDVYDKKLGSIVKICKTIPEKIKDKKSMGLCLLGQVGSGKTHLAIAVLQELFKLGIPALYWSYRERILRIKQLSMQEGEYSREIRKPKQIEVLMIDDLFKGGITNADINIMFEIVNYRYLNNLPVIITSEMLINQILNVDEGVGSRIVEMCRPDVIEIQDKGLNYRLKGRR